MLGMNETDFLYLIDTDSDVEQDARRRFQQASNIVGGDNPPFTMEQFYEFAPQFLALTAVPGTGGGSAGSTALTGLGTLFTALFPGVDLLIGTQVRQVASITDDTHIVLLTPFAASCALASISVGAPLIPPNVLSNLLLSAHDTLQASRLGPRWSYCMGLYLAHHCTVYLWAQADPSTIGLKTGEHIDEVAERWSYAELVSKLTINAKAYTLTTYGQLLLTETMGPSSMVV